ncbi:MAG: tetratricopeptide repeat protein [Thermoanaerobaculia bacterium]
MVARRALELDPLSADAHLASALVAAVVHWDWGAALAGIERAVTLAPESPDVWLWRGSLLSALGRHDRAIASTRRALELDPTAPAAHAALAWHLFHARRGDEAIAQAHRALELQPDYYDAWDNLKWIARTLGREAVAVKAWIRTEEIDAGDGEAVRRNYEAGGLERLHREAIASQVAAWEAGHYQAPYDVALEHAALGEVDAAMLWLERSFAERETDLVSLAVDPRLDPLRDDPRFQELLERMAFPVKDRSGS